MRFSLCLVRGGDNPSADCVGTSPYTGEAFGRAAQPAPTEGKAGAGGATRPYDGNRGRQLWRPYGDRRDGCPPQVRRVDQKSSQFSQSVPTLSASGLTSSTFMVMVER